LRRAIKQGKADPSTGGLIIAYTLAKALAISPLEIYKMPAQMVMDLLTIHGIVEQMKADEMDKIKRSVK
jgi:hypothetical protein